MAVFQLLNALAIRSQRYGAIAIRNVTVGLATLALQVALGAAGLGVSGLLLGWGLGQLAGALSLLRKSGLSDASARQSYTLRQGKAILRRFRHVPTVLAPAGALNVMGLQLPVILLAALHGPDVAGQFGLTQRVLTAPVALIGLAVAQVYLGSLAAVRRAGGEPPVRVFRDATRQLAVIGAIGTAVLLVFSEPLFLWVYGSSWATSGQMARMLSIALLFQIVASPLSQTLVVYGRHKTQLAWDSSRLLIVGSTVYFSSALGASPVQTVAGLSLATAATYALSWYLSWRTLAVAHAQWSQERPPRQLA
ncbi:oligosaccharide flippase family protein [Nocardioides sp. 503]|uniref:oligosaccharide flippase family protein n=1 Tax=Nocardioides sp. 503 TaxID=2508326 RepID=UPI00106F0ED0|nr:oligosaccharide flippase family protein [Nocardioides sp. 503]